MKTDCRDRPYLLTTHFLHHRDANLRLQVCCLLVLGILRHCFIKRTPIKPIASIGPIRYQRIWCIISMQIVHYGLIGRMWLVHRVHRFVTYAPLHSNNYAPCSSQTTLNRVMDGQTHLVCLASAFFGDNHKHCINVRRPLLRYAQFPPETTLNIASTFVHTPATFLTPLFKDDFNHRTFVPMHPEHLVPRL